jgi:uncharacterized OB-fold protein
MKAVKCKECGGAVSSSASKCPHCGSTNPTSLHVLASVVAGLVVLFGVLYFVYQWKKVWKALAELWQGD